MKKIYYVVLATFMLLFMQQANAQIYQQTFPTDSAGFSNRSMVSSATSYARSSSTSNSQATLISSSGAGSTVSVTNGALTNVRTGNSLALVRNAAFSNGALMFRFDFTSSSTTSTQAAQFCVGNTFANSASSTSPSIPFGSNSNTHSLLYISTTTGTPSTWGLNNGGAVNSVNTYTGNVSRTILWVVNNTGAAITYRAPDGTNESLADDKYDVWVGSVREMNEVAANDGTQSITNFAFRNGNSTGTQTFDNILVDLTPTVPTSSAATSIGTNGFTANWTAVSGVTGYRLDVATDAAFTNIVQSNVYVSGQATTSRVFTGLNSSTQYYYRVRSASQYTVDEFGSGNSTSQTATTTCSNPSITVNPSTTNYTLCQNVSATSLSVTATGASSYQWYSNASATNSGGSAISGATSATYTPSTTSIGTLYYYCIALSGACSSSASAVSGSYAVVAAPSPTFTTAPSATTVIGSSVTYTTQFGGSSYSWSVPGTAGVDYDITAGGIGSSDYTVTLTWKTTGSKTVTVNYSNGSCSGASSASSITNVTATTFYNKANSDITILSNWGLNSDGSGTAPTDFTSAGLTFNMYNANPSMSTAWSPNGAGTVVNIGSSVSLTASSTFSPTVVNMANGASLQIQTATIPTFGTLGASSTVDYAGTSQAVTATSYGNLTISGSGVTLSGTTSIAGTFTPGSATATSGTIVLNGTSSSQAIPAFAYQSLTVSGVDGKSTSGSLTIAGSLTMTNSFTLASSHTLLMDSTGSMSSTAGKTLTVNGTFDRRFASTSNTFSAGSGLMQIAGSGTFRVSGVTSGNNGTPSQTTLTNVNFASGTSGGTLHVTASAAPRIPSAVAGNVIWDVNATSFGIYNLVGSTSNTIGGHLTIASTGQSILSLAGGSSSRALTVSGNLYMPNGGRFDLATYSTTATTTATGPNVLTVNGDVILNNAADTLYTTCSPTASASGTINIKGNLVHTAGVIGKAITHRSSADLTGTVASASYIVFNGTSSQDITTTGTIENNTNVSVSNAAGVRMLTNMTIDGSVTLTSGLLRTNGNTLTVAGTNATPFTGTSFGAAATSYVAICDASGATSSTGGVTVTNIGSGGRTGAILFPIGATPTTYNPLTINNASSAVAFTAKVNNSTIAGVSPSTDAVQRTWNIQPASGSPSSVIALQWTGSEEGSTFTRTSAAVAHSTGSAIDVQSAGANAAGTNPYSLSSGGTSFTSYGDFGVTNGVVALATEPTVQASNVILSAGVDTMNISWTKGTDASNSLVIIKAVSLASANPADATSYTASTVYGSGTAIGGGYVAYTGTGNSVTVSGLTPNVTYYVTVYSFNTSGGAENYLTSTAGASANATTGLYTYYYVAGVGGTTSASSWAVAGRWATSKGGTPLSAFTATNNDVYIFDGSNLGTTASPYTGTASIAAVNPTNVIGKIIVRNNANVVIASTNSATSITLGNSSFSANTTVLSVEFGSTLSFNGSTYTGINLQANSSANISGTLNLGSANNAQLIPNPTGSTITFNSGAICESNQSSGTAPFGTSVSGVVTFADSSTFKHTKGADAFGGAGFNVASFASKSLYWFNNTSTSSSFNLDGRTYGNVKVSTSATPAAGANGFTIYNLELAGSTTKLSTAFAGTNNHIKGNIIIPAGDTLRFNPTSASTLNFSGTTAQTTTINSTSGLWQVISTCLQSYVLSNTAGLSVDGSMNIGQTSGTSFTINSGTNLSLVSGTLTVTNLGSLNVNGTITRTAGTITQSSSTAPIVFSGMSSIPSGLFVSNTAKALEINRSAGITLNSDLTISNSLTLTNGAVTTGANTVIMSTGATVSRTNGWVNGNLRKNVSSGSNVVRTFEIGDASNYLPVSMTFASVTTAGDMTAKISAPASSQPNYATATVSNSNYINRYWSLSSVNTLAFTNYN
ncbi:MAG: hypothetical protein NTZ59_10435, partial [Bacteroidetes bacterium]|nr:hypothetical protein [Bacteroidota bacterium]